MKEKTSDRVGKLLLKVIGVLVVIVCLIGVFDITNTIMGNPISKKLAENTATEFLEKHSGDCYELKDVYWDLFDGNYVALMQSPEAEFSLIISSKGELLLIDYSYYDYAEK